MDFNKYPKASGGIVSRYPKKSAPIPKSENVLQRALKQGTQTMGKMFEGNPVVSEFLPTSTSFQARATKSKAIGNVVKNPLLALGADVATDPMTYMAPSSAKSAVGAVTLPGVATKSGRVSVVEKLGKQLQRKRWHTLPRWFGRQIDKFSSANPTATIDISGALKDASVQASTDPKLASTLSHPAIQELMSDMTRTRNMTLAEVQDLKNIVTEGVPEAVKSGVKGLRKFRKTNAFTDIINSKIAETFPEMKSVAKKYGEKAEQYKEFAPAFRGGKKVEKTIGKQGVFTYFGSPDYLGGESAQMALRKFSPRISKEIGSARRTNQLINAAKIGAVGLGATYAPFSWPVRRIAEHLVD